MTNLSDIKTEKYYFISDIHLGLNSKEIENQKERLLVKLLNFISTDASDLFIIGDLYDYWFEYKRVYQKGFFRTLTALQDLTEKGIRLHYFYGNHDFMHKNFFEKEIGATVYEDSLEIILDNKKFFLSHGDNLMKNDIGYKFLRKILRNKFNQFLFYLIHPDLGIKIASGTSKTSRDYTSSKFDKEEDDLFKSAKEIIEKGFDYVILGHLHRRQYLSHYNGYYINLGSWLDNPCYGVFYNNKFEIIDWK